MVTHGEAQEAAIGAPYEFSATNQFPSFQVSAEVGTTEYFQEEAPFQGDVRNFIPVLRSPRCSRARISRKKRFRKEYLVRTIERHAQTDHRRALLCWYDAEHLQVTRNIGQLGIHESRPFIDL